MEDDIIQGSTLKNFNFSGYTPEQKLEKYENVLASREKQVTTLAMEIGKLNDKLNIVTEQYEKYKSDFEKLAAQYVKIKKALEQELSNKEIMFIRLERKENEYDELKKKFDVLLRAHGPVAPTTSLDLNINRPKKEIQIKKENNINNNNDSNNPFNALINNNNVVNINETNNNNIKDNTNNNQQNINKAIENKDNENKNNNESNKEEKQVKMSARNRIAELKAKNTNLTKINFAELLHSNEVKKEADKKQDEIKKEEVVQKEDENKKEEVVQKEEVIKKEEVVQKEEEIKKEGENSNQPTNNNNNAEENK